MKTKTQSIILRSNVIAERIRKMAGHALESWAQSKADKVPTKEGARRGGKNNCAG